MALTLADVLAARRTIAGVAVAAPLVPSPFMEARSGHAFLLKLELAQATGAFKLRGATNAVMSLAEGVAGVTCCSTGNHGRGVAYAAHARGIRAVICMSALVPQAKVEGIGALGAEVKIVGRSQDAAQRECLRLVAEEGLTEISPFDDPLVVAGQGTIGLELLEERPDLAAILVPLSGGGLAGGIALAAKAIRPSVRVIGISMDRGAAKHHTIPARPPGAPTHDSIRARHPVEVEEVPSLADSLGGGIGLDNRLTFALCRDLLDDIVLVTEEEIYRAMQAIYYEERIVCEGASAVGHAAVLAGKLSLSGPTATVVTGRNVDMGVHADIMQGRDVSLGDLTLKGEPYAA